MVDVKGLANELRFLCLILTGCGTIKTTQMCAVDAMKSKQMTNCCAWSKSGCVRLVLLLSFNDPAVPEILPMVWLFRKFPRGCGCTLHFQKLLLLKVAAAPVISCQWFPSCQEWCDCFKRKAPWCGCLLMLRKNHPFSSFLDFLSLVQLVLPSMRRLSP